MVKFSILDKGVPVNVTTTTADGNLSLGIAWSTKDFHTVKCKVDVVDDPATPVDETCVAGQFAGDRGRGTVVNLIANAAVVANGDGTFTYTSPTLLPPGVDGDVMVTLYGRRHFADTSRAYPESAIFFRARSGNRWYPRRSARTATSSSNPGGARAGDPMMCNACHNSSGGWLDEGFGPIALGAFAHNIHAATGVAVDFAEVTYPQSLSRCEACHLPGTYYAARADALPISTGPGVDVQNLYDDTWDSATAGTCGTCHSSGPAKPHGAERRPVRGHRRQDARGVVGLRGLRRLPRRGPLGGYGGGTRRVMLIGRASCGTPGPLRMSGGGFKGRALARPFLMCSPLLIADIRSIKTGG